MRSCRIHPNIILLYFISSDFIFSDRFSFHCNSHFILLSSSLISSVLSCPVLSCPILSYSLFLYSLLLLFPQASTMVLGSHISFSTLVNISGDFRRYSSQSFESNLKRLTSLTLHNMYLILIETILFSRLQIMLVYVHYLFSSLLHIAYCWELTLYIF